MTGHSSRFLAEPNELPDHYTTANRSDGVVAHWKRLFKAGTNENLVRICDGIADVYVKAAGEATGSAEIGLLHRRGPSYSLMRLEYSATQPSFYRLSSRYDANSDKYLIYAPHLPFVPRNNVKTSSWKSFDAWLFDIKSESVEHIVLPAGPWVANARLDGVLLRGFRNFSAGTDAYRGYDLKLLDRKIQITISGKPSAISRGVTGTYQLAPDRKSWEKI